MGKNQDLLVVGNLLHYLYTKIDWKHEKNEYPIKYMNNWGGQY